MSVNDRFQLVGSTVADKYAIDALVSEDPFASVYQGVRVIVNRPVSLRVFSAFASVSAETRKSIYHRMVPEEITLSDLAARAPAIHATIDIGTLPIPSAEVDAGWVPYVVCESLRGTTLSAMMESERQQGGRRRELVDAMAFLEPIAVALALAHEKNLAHLNVCPANILRLDAGGLKLLEFGTAKLVDDLAAAGYLRTPDMNRDYEAPEQLTGMAPSGARADVFSLALILVELVYGASALANRDALERAKAACDPLHRPTPRALGIDISAEIDEIFARALAVQAQERIATVGEFWSSLRRALELPPLRSMMATIPPEAPVVDSGHFTTTRTPVPSSWLPLRDSNARRSARKPNAAIATGTLAIAMMAGFGGTMAWTQLGHRMPKNVTHAVTVAIATANNTGAASAASKVASKDSNASAVSPAPACPSGMIAIDPGQFFMGYDDGFDFEKPAHKVHLGAYCIDKFEVTTAQYKACSDSGGCKRAGQTNDWDGISDVERKVFDNVCNIRAPEEKAQHPINCVNWDLADNYCRSHGARLPTEAEWEFAARGPDGRQYPWGDEAPTAEYLNACGRECLLWQRKNRLPERAMFAVDDGFPTTAPVGSFPKGASRFGLMDVVGNVWEWVGDWYGDYGANEKTDPQGPDHGEKRVVRGGAWNGSFATWVRPTFRYSFSPASRSHGIGFRCAKSR